MLGDLARPTVERLVRGFGLTGLAQVSGRNALTWEEKFALDVWYVDNRSLRLDLGILVKTVVNVVRREGISAEGSATMPKFGG